MARIDGFARVTPGVMLGMNGLNGAERLTFIALRSLAGLDVSCYATAPQLAQMTGLSVRTIHAVLAALEASGWVMSTRESRKICYYPRRIDAKSEPLPDWLLPNAVFAGFRAESDAVRARAESELLPHQKKTKTEVTETEDDDRTKQTIKALLEVIKDLRDQLAKPTVSPIPLDPYERRPGESEQDYGDRMDDLAIAMMPDEPEPSEPEDPHAQKIYGRTDITEGGKYTITKALPAPIDPDAPKTVAKPSEPPPIPRWRQALNDQ